MVALAQPDPLDALRLPAGASPSGYRNVYRKRRAWVARVKVAGRLINLSCPESGAYYHPNPRAAARLVGAWYADRYGPDWSLMFRRAPGRHGTDRRRANPWAFRHWHHVSYEGGRPRKTFAGWVVSVWEFGREKMLGDHLHPTNPRLDRAKRRPWVYPTREAAAAGLREWRAVSLPRRWGEKAASALGR